MLRKCRSTPSLLEIKKYKSSKRRTLQDDDFRLRSQIMSSRERVFQDDQLSTRFKIVRRKSCDCCECGSRNEHIQRLDGLYPGINEPPRPPALVRP